MIKTMKFAITVESIKKFGFDPLARQFVLGVHVMSATSPLTWERKLDLYKSFGWSEEEIISAFTKHPNCMLISDKKIKQMIDFYVNKLHWASHVLLANPKLLCHGLESRVLPRCCVLSVLSSKGLIKRYPCVINGVLRLNENKFYNKYVSKYMDQVPEVLEAYKGNLQFMGFDCGPSTVQGS
ncbi:uncharacterized protein A4U43_UnF7660 [Asparagus officinalis]|uniref:Uncharacterized protein n=1 Tax=Asparagus officinalis TaxID=4686 RepID=A0A1R3L663_ASPOF|nr:uncharacterized protein A4U43_UnF7660 [Asparagus officinalis]